MTGQNTTNTTAFIEAQQYSSFIIENLPDIMLPDGFTRDVSDFGSGTTLNIKTVGAVTLQDVTEDVPLTFNSIDTGTVTMSITDYPGDAWKISDELREDGAQIDQLSAMRAMESTRAMAEYFETRFLQVANGLQTANAANTINGVRHRIVGGDATGSVNTIEVADFAYMDYAFNQARVPQAGRIALVHPSVAYKFDTITNITNVSNNPMFEGMITEGFSQNHKFVRNVYGWDIYTTSFLPTIATNESSLTERDGSTAPAATTVGYVPNIFMCVLDDQTKPVMRAWRRMPKTEGWRDPETRSDKFQVTARLGFGGQRADTLGVVLTSTTLVG